MSDYLSFIDPSYTQLLNLRTIGQRLEIEKRPGFETWLTNSELVNNPRGGISPRHQADREKLHQILDNWLDGKGLSDEF